MPHQITDQTLTQFYKTYSPVLIAQNLAGIPSGKELERIIVPPEFDAKIEALIAGLGCDLEIIPSKRPGKRMMIVLVAALLTAATTVMTVSALREWMITVVTKNLNTHTAISIYDSKVEEISPSALISLPDGYQVFTKQTSDKTAYTVYAKPYGNIQLTESVFATDWENLPNLQTSAINGISVQYREDSEKNFKQFFWQHNSLYYTLNITDQTLSLDDVLAIIENMKYGEAPEKPFNNEKQLSAAPFFPYTLSYLPEGYVQTGQTVRSNQRYLKETYCLETDDRVTIRLMQIGKGKVNVDSEHLDEYDNTVTVNGESATYFRKRNRQTVLFGNGSYYFIIQIQGGTISKETAMQIAEGVVLADPS